MFDGGNDATDGPRIPRTCITIDLSNRHAVSASLSATKRQMFEAPRNGRSVGSGNALSREMAQGIRRYAGQQGFRDHTAYCGDVGLAAPLYRPPRLTVGIISSVPGGAKYAFMRSRRHPGQCHHNTL